MKPDPVVEQVRKARREICQRYDFDPIKIARAIREGEKNYQGRLVDEVKPTQRVKEAVL